MLLTWEIFIRIAYTSSLPIFGKGIRVGNCNKARLWHLQSLSLPLKWNVYMFILMKKILPYRRGKSLVLIIPAPEFNEVTWNPKT